MHVSIIVIRHFSRVIFTKENLLGLEEGEYINGDIVLFYQQLVQDKWLSECCVLTIIFLGFCTRQWWHTFLTVLIYSISSILTLSHNIKIEALRTNPSAIWIVIMLVQNMFSVTSLPRSTCWYQWTNSVFNYWSFSFIISYLFLQLSLVSHCGERSSHGPGWQGR